LHFVEITDISSMSHRVRRFVQDRRLRETNSTVEGKGGLPWQRSLPEPVSARERHSSDRWRWLHSASLLH